MTLTAVSERAGRRGGDWCAAVASAEGDTLGPGPAFAHWVSFSCVMLVAMAAKAVFSVPAEASK